MPNILNRYALVEPQVARPAGPDSGRIPALLVRLASRTADGIADARVVLPWLVSFVGAPLAFAALLVPLREGLAPLALRAVESPLRPLADRRWIGPVALLVQGIAIFAISAVALALFGAQGGAAILALATLAALAAALRPTAAAETAGSSGAVYAIAALSVALFGLALAIPVGPRGALVLWAIMLAGGLCLLAALLAFATGPAAPAEASAPADLAAALFAAPALAIPFLVAAISANPGQALTLLGSLILAGSLGRLALPLLAGTRALSAAAALATLALGAALVFERLTLLTAPLVLPAIVAALTLADAAARAGLARRGTGGSGLAVGFLSGAVLAPFGPPVALAALTVAAALSVGAARRIERPPFTSAPPPA